LSNSPHGSEEYIDFAVVHRALGQPRYTFKFYFIQLTLFEAVFTLSVTLALWWIIQSLHLESRKIFGILSWEALPFFLLFGLPLIFSLVHLARPDLKIWETVSGAFVPTQFKDLPDKAWKPSNRRAAARRTDL
jgi:hypothetical protein